MKKKTRNTAGSLGLYECAVGDSRIARERKVIGPRECHVSHEIINLSLQERDHTFSF